MRNWRISTWLLILWTALCVLTAVALIAGLSNVCTAKTPSAAPTCQDWTTIFGGLALWAVFLMWLPVAVVLGLVWAIRRPKEPEYEPGKRPRAVPTPAGRCPACSTRIADVREVCPRCGHSPQASFDRWQGNGGSGRG
jgi:hypothetical protein